MNPGTIVSARGREWVVQPGTSDDLVMLRPLYGMDAETVGILPALESVTPAVFVPPSLEMMGDFATCELLRDATRLASRSSSGPFRCFASLGCEPKPYQLVPLLLGMRQPTVRVLIADDVGIGKTIEASLIAAELLARGDATRLAVLCPPHLAEQWQRELRSKFHMDPVLVLGSTAARLERDLPADRSIFEAYPQMVISIDFVKGPRYRAEFLRSCPDCVIVDEAHACTVDVDGVRSRQERHALLARVAEDPKRHLVLVTATPHSGNTGAFRSLISLLEPSLSQLPDDLTGPENEANRRRLAQYLVQRRRADIEHFAGSDTPFPKRIPLPHATYRLSPQYRTLLDRALAFCRDRVRSASDDRRKQRVHIWAAISLLRAISSSPAAALASLRGLAAGAGDEAVEEVDRAGRRAALDGDAADAEGSDGGSDSTGGVLFKGEPELLGASQPGRRTAQERELADMAEVLSGDADPKLAALVRQVREMLERGRRPIVFCRYIPTAQYVARELEARIRRRGLVVTAITGELPPSEREARVDELKQHESCILVASDCLSEGVNLQDHFDAVVHYDLPWNPTRLEQREGRVDRFNQRSPDVEVGFVFGEDNHVDGHVFKVLVERHQRIRAATGVTVPVPAGAEKVMEAIYEWLVMQSDATAEELLPGMEQFMAPQQAELQAEWDRQAERERRSRTMFAQEAIKPLAAARWVSATRESGGSVDVARFVERAVRAAGGTAGRQPDGSLRLSLSGASMALRDMLPDSMPEQFDAVFSGAASGDQVMLQRTHPYVAALAGFVMQSSLDPEGALRYGRSGAFSTNAVRTSTTLLLLRLRYSIDRVEGQRRRQLSAEECRFVAFEGLAELRAQDRVWVDDDRVESLLLARPSGNLPNAALVVADTVAALPSLGEELMAIAERRAAELLRVYREVRDQSGTTGVRLDLRPNGPPDVVAVHVLVPA
jgi:hypothetical protein